DRQGLTREDVVGERLRLEHAAELRGGRRLLAPRAPAPDRAPSDDDRDGAQGANARWRNARARGWSRRSTRHAAILLQARNPRRVPHLPRRARASKLALAHAQDTERTGPVGSLWISLRWITRASRVV